MHAARFHSRLHLQVHDMKRISLQSHLREHALQVRRVGRGHLLLLGILAVFHIVVVIIVALDVGRRVFGQIVAQHGVALLAGTGAILP